MKFTNPPVLSIQNFEDYNSCQHCGNSFYVRVLDQHLKDNLFLDKPHTHDFFILLLITEGKGIHNIDFKTYEVKPNSIFFLSPGQVHNWTLSEDANGYIIFFTREYLLLDSNHNRLNKLPFFNTQFNNPFMDLNWDETGEILRLFKNIDQEYLLHKKLFHEAIRLNLSLLLITLERNYTGKTQSPGLLKYQDSLFRKFENMVDDLYKDHVSISDYADKMNISLKQLNTICKKALNKTPGEIVQARIILEAKRLLVHTDHSIASIAFHLNYSDSSYFIRLFKKVTAITPEQFRANNLKESQVSLDS